MALLLLLVFAAAPWALTAQSIPSCEGPNSAIYCEGPLLDTVQMAAIFNDSKTFVDMRLLHDVATVLLNYETLMNSTGNNPSTTQIRAFVDGNFAEGDEFGDWTPPDLPENPAILAEIEDEGVRNFTAALIDLWAILARKVKPEVFENEELYSLIPVENGFVVPGGRFKEFYYWDSYWIIKGLLISEMHETAKGMLLNFLSIVKRYGYIPNGARVYYLNRSQPPLLTMMVNDYVEATGDVQFLKDNIETLEQELQFFLDNRVMEVVKDGVSYTVAHYDSESGSPRPESYRQDVQNAHFYENEEDRKQLYADLKSGAESGWDFGSRWIVDENGGNIGNISLVKVRRIIPVDLNAFLCKDFRLLSDFHLKLMDIDKSILWMEKSAIWQKTIEEVFYNAADGIWYDYDSVLQVQRAYFYPSNFAPLWGECYLPVDRDRVGKAASDYFKAQGLLDYQGGIPASTAQTGEQWDFPNAWAPLQTIVIQGLERSGNSEALRVAEEMAKRWVSANMIGYDKTKEMFEKYDAVVPGNYGGGGEYTVQPGFGWSNGVALEFIKRYYT